MKLTNISYTKSGNALLTVEMDRATAEMIMEEYQDADVDVTVKKHSNKRSLDANAYFHVLVNAIARKTNSSDTDIKRRLVEDYGTLAKDCDGKTIGFKLPATVDVTQIYPYTRCFDTRFENGIQFNCYLVYKQTHTLDSAEMAHLIDGTIQEAKDLGIVTETPNQIAEMKSRWGDRL